MKIRLLVTGMWICMIVGCGSGGGVATISGPEAAAVNDFVYKLDESSGATAVNSASQYFNGTIYGASRVTGKVGNALLFGNAGGRVEIHMDGPISKTTNLSTISFDNNTISIGAWIKLDTITAGSINNIVGNRDDGLTCFRFQLNNGNLELLISDGNYWHTIIRGTQTLATGTWYHVAVTYDGTTAISYVDGTIDKTNNITYKIPVNYNNIYIGAVDYNNVYQLLGTIDEVRISKQLWSATDINNNYQQTK